MSEYSLHVLRDLNLELCDCKGIPVSVESFQDRLKIPSEESAIESSLKLIYRGMLSEGFVVVLMIVPSWSYIVWDYCSILGIS